MRVNFKDCLTETLKWEGGYSDHPKDPGGKTNFGVIQRVYNSYRRLKGLGPRHVKSITKSEVEDIYRSMYWDNVGGDTLPIGLDLVVFDFGVNSGPSRSIKFLQKALNKVDGLNLKVDGLLGPATIDAATGTPDVHKLITRICDDRLGWLNTLKTFVTFGKGWTRRVRGIKSKALEMATQGLRIVEQRPEVPEELAPVPTPPADTMWKVSVTGLVGALGTGLVSAVNNPFALIFMLAVLGGAGWMFYSYGRSIKLDN